MFGSAQCLPVHSNSPYQVPLLDSYIKSINIVGNAWYIFDYQSQYTLHSQIDLMYYIGQSLKSRKQEIIYHQIYSALSPFISNFKIYMPILLPRFVALNKRKAIVLSLNLSMYSLAIHAPQFHSISCSVVSVTISILIYYNSLSFISKLVFLSSILLHPSSENRIVILEE